MQNGNLRDIRPPKTTEPSVTLSDEGTFLLILTKLPEVIEEKIRINLENHSTLVTIMASNSSIQYKKEIILPCKVRLSKKRFSDGVLELILEKINTEPHM